LVQVALTEDEDVVQALAPDAAKEALDDGVGTGRSDRRPHDPDPARPGQARECRPELLGGRWSLLTTASLQNWT
jgi:hypothetical protein